MRRQTESKKKSSPTQDSLFREPTTTPDFLADLIPEGVERTVKKRRAEPVVSIADLRFAELDRGVQITQRELCEGLAYAELETTYLTGTLEPRGYKAYRKLVDRLRSTVPGKSPWPATLEFIERCRQGDFADSTRLGGTIRLMRKQEYHERERESRGEKKPSSGYAIVRKGEVKSYAELGFDTPYQPARPASTEGQAVVEPAPVAAEVQAEVADDESVDVSAPVPLSTGMNDAGVYGRMQVRHPEAAEYFVVELGNGFQSVALVVDDKSVRGGLSLLDSKVYTFKEDVVRKLRELLQRKLAWAVENREAVPLN